jgi:hypothetical protein
MNRITHRAAALLLVLTATAAANADDHNAPAALPDDVAQALAQPQCAELLALNKHYWILPESPARLAATAALENAILGISGCGVSSAQLIRVEQLSGGNFFDYPSPLGASSPES